MPRYTFIDGSEEKWFTNCTVRMKWSIKKNVIGFYFIFFACCHQQHKEFIEISHFEPVIKVNVETKRNDIFKTKREKILLMMNLSCSGSTEKHLVFDFSVGRNKKNTRLEWSQWMNAYDKCGIWILHTQWKRERVRAREMAIFKCTAEEFEKDANFYVRLFCRKIFSIPLIKTCFEMVVCVSECDLELGRIWVLL